MARHLPVWLAAMEMATTRLVYIHFHRVKPSWWVVCSARRKCGDLLVTINRLHRSNARSRYYPCDKYVLYEVAMARIELVLRGFYGGR